MGVRMRMSREVKHIFAGILWRRSTNIRMRREVLNRGHLCDVVTCRVQLGGPTPPSWFRREAQDLRSLSGPRIFVRSASVWCLVIRTRFLRGAIGTVLASRTGTVTSSFSTSADKPIEFIPRQTNNGVIREGNLLPWKTGSVNTRALGAFNGQRLVRREFNALAFSARFLGGFLFRLRGVLGRTR